jgi:hypothetical protein
VKSIVIRVVKSRRIRWAGHAARLEADAIKFESENPKGGPTRRSEDNIRTDLIERRGGGGVGWMYLTRARNQWRAVVNTVMNLGVP